MTITSTEIQESIKTCLAAAFPGEMIYEEIMPQEFQRPSNLLKLMKIELDTQSLGHGAVSFRYQYKITTFTEADQVHNSHLAVLTLRAVMILGAFAAGYLKVEDRAPRVAALMADTGGYDSAEVLLTLTLTMDRGEFEPAELLPIMRKLTTRYETEEEHL